MSEAEKLTVGILMSVIVLFAPGFLLHEAPRFPNTVLGGLLGIAGAALFLLLLIYSLVKRSPHLRARVSKLVSLRTALSFHVYAGVVGALLGLLHSGHTYRSPLGIALVATMLIVVLSGFVGRYYLAQVGADLREQQQELRVLRTRFDQIAAQGVSSADGGSAPSSPMTSWLLALLRSRSGDGRAAAVPADLRPVVVGIADLEHAIGQREVLKKALSRWTVLHVAAALVLYALLALHIWNGFYFGLRWLR